MKRQTIYGILCFGAIVVAFIVGFKLADIRNKVAVMSGPYSDYYGPALSAIETAEDKLKNGDTHVQGELDQAKWHIKRSQEWTKEFLDLE